MAEPDQALAAAPRDQSPNGNRVSTDPVHLADADRPSPRRLDASQLMLTAIRIGPGLMLVAVVIVIASLSPVFLSTRNVTERPAGGIHRVLCRHSFGRAVLGLELEVRPNFAFRLVVAAVSHRGLHLLEHSCHCGDQIVPPRFLNAQLLSTFRRQAIEAHLAAPRGLFPPRRNAAAFL